MSSAPRRRASFVRIAPQGAAVEEQLVRERSFGPRDEVSPDSTATPSEGEPVQADMSLVVVDDAVLTWADDKQGDWRGGSWAQGCRRRRSC